MVAILGIPDYLGVIDGRFIALELKKSGKKSDDARSLQKYVLKQIRKAGGWTAVVTPQNWKKVYEKLREL